MWNPDNKLPQINMTRGSFPGKELGSRIAEFFFEFQRHVGRWADSCAGPSHADRTVATDQGVHLSPSVEVL
jgi:hypothetical protein